MRALQALGCEEIQGYYFARPIPGTRCWVTSSPRAPRSAAPLEDGSTGAARGIGDPAAVRGRDRRLRGACPAAPDLPAAPVGQTAVGRRRQPPRIALPRFT